MGLMLGLMAWCMQLVVFVQPFLPGQSMPGLGICQVIVDAFISPQALISQHQTARYQSLTPTQQLRSEKLSTQHTAKHLHHDQPDAAQPIVLTSSHAPQVDHHFSHLSCGFCMLYGHAIPPPDAPALWLQFAINPYIAPPQFFNNNNNILAADYLQPKSRAPPIIYFI